MHEMSLAQHIIEISRQYVPEGEGRKIKAIHLTIGKGAGVVTESLEFCFSAITQHTEFENTCLQIEHIPLKVYCHSCGAEEVNDDLLSICTVCGSANVNITGGTELEVSKIELVEQKEDTV